MSEEPNTGIDPRLGFVWLPRDLRNHPVMRRPNALSLYVWILCRARYQAGVVLLARGSLELQPGQCAYGEEEAATALGMGRATIRSATQMLEKLGLIARKTTSLGTVATVLGYEGFRPNQPANQPASRQRTNQRAASEPTTKKTVKTDKTKKTFVEASAPPTPPLSAQAEVEGAPWPQVQHHTPRQAPPPTHGEEVDGSQRGAARELLRAQKATPSPSPLPFTVRDLGQAFARGAQGAFAGDSWDGGLARPVTSVIRALSLAGRDLGDVERAGRLVKGWRLSEPLTWAWIAKAGNLAGAIAKAHGTEATRAAAQAVRGEFQEWQ